MGGMVNITLKTDGINVVVCVSCARGYLPGDNCLLHEYSI